ncbi:MAG TPA: DUF4349 domain-containing protein [Dehalococcoidia bacterium]
MRKHLLPLLLLAAAALVTAGCGQRQETAPPADGGREPAVFPVKEAGQAGSTAPAAADAAGAASSTGQESGGGGTDLPSNLLDRKITYHASLDLTVEDVLDRRREVERIAGAAGGYVAAGRTYGEGDDRTAELTLRVPADRYEAVMEDLRGLAVEVKDEQASSQDLTEEYTDLEARLRNLEAVEQQYLALLGRATQIGEVLQVQDRLNATRAEIERVRGRIQLLDRMTELATIDVRLTPAAPGADGGRTPGWDPLRAAERAWDASLRLLAAVAEAGIMAAVFSWWLLPLLVLAGWLARRWRLRTAARSESGAAGP